MEIAFSHSIPSKEFSSFFSSLFIPHTQDVFHLSHAYFFFHIVSISLLSLWPLSHASPVKNTHMHAYACFSLACLHISPEPSPPPSPLPTPLSFIFFPILPSPPLTPAFFFFFFFLFCQFFPGAPYL